MKMGKQAKIGITAVSVLLVIGGAIAATNICSSTTDPQETSSAEGDRQSGITQVNPEQHARRTVPPKVVLPVRIAAKPLMDPPGKGGTAGAIGGENLAPSATAPVHSPAPTFMPNPPKRGINLADRKLEPPMWMPYRPSDAPTPAETERPRE